MAMFKDLFRSKQRQRYAKVKPPGEPSGRRRRRRAAPPLQRPERQGVPDGIWTKMSGCQTIHYEGELAKHLYVHPCGHHFTVEAVEPGAAAGRSRAFEEWD